MNIPKMILKAEEYFMNIRFLKGKRFVSIREKLIISFIIIVILMDLISLYPLFAYNSPISKYQQIMQNITSSNEIITNCNGLYTWIENISYSIDIIKKPETQEKYKKYKKDIVTSLNTIKKNISGRNADNAASVLSDFGEVEKVTNAFLEQADTIMSADESIKRDIRLKATESNSKIIIYIEELNKKYLVSEIGFSKIIQKEIKTLTRTIFSISLSLTLIMLVLCALFAFLISSSISNPLRKITEMAKSISNGHLNINKLSYEKNDELKQLKGFKYV